MYRVQAPYLFSQNTEKVHKKIVNHEADASINKILAPLQPILFPTYEAKKCL